jgi:SAM-dependent methyltransferase
MLDEIRMHEVPTRSAQQVFLLKSFQARERIHQLSRIRPLSAGSTFLEIGPGDGATARFAMEQNLKVSVVELDEARRRTLKDQGFMTFSSLEELSTSRFDYVVAFYVLEYCFYPRNFVNSLRDLCNIQGVLQFVTPNAKSALSTVLYAPAWPHFFFNTMSCNYFTFSALRRLSEQVFGNSSWRTIIETRQGYSLYNNLNWVFTGVPMKSGATGQDSLQDVIEERITRPESPNELKGELVSLLKEWDQEYKKYSEKLNLGNELILSALRTKE